MQKQQLLSFPTPRLHGGTRKGAGRKPNGTRAGVTHAGRPRFHKPRVLHITCRIAAGLPSLRDALTAEILMDYLASRCIKRGFRLVEYSIQGNHLHLICEASNHEAQSQGMNGLQSGIARTLNNHLDRRGKIFDDRYHVELLETPTQCRKALRYGFHNAKKHGARSRTSALDPFSTAPWFPFTRRTKISNHPKPAAYPRTWLLKFGYRRAGPIYTHDHPSSPKPRRARRRVRSRDPPAALEPEPNQHPVAVCASHPVLHPLPQPPPISPSLPQPGACIIPG